jgi:hypothetical protein
MMRKRGTKECGSGFIAIIISLILLFIVIIVNSYLDKRHLHYIMYEKQYGNGEPIPKGWGTEPPPEHRRILPRYRSNQKDCLTNEELLENIEDAEMKGTADDEVTLEDLKQELK